PGSHRRSPSLPAWPPPAARLPTPSGRAVELSGNRADSAGARLSGSLHSFSLQGRYFEAARTTSRLRPLSRRRLSTARPCLVELRFLKPCARFRFTFDG